MEYTLQFLPIAKKDLSNIVNYILNDLQNPIAAENTLNKIEKEIYERLENGSKSLAIW